MSETKKTCFKCEAEKPLSEFYRHPQMFDGHLNKCKQCTRADVYEHRHHSESREKILAYDRARGNRQGPDYEPEYRRKNPVKYKAHRMVSNAVRDGKLEKPEHCSHRKKKKRLHGHHEDYNKPLEVIWLCAECHRNLHAIYETVGRKIPA